MSEPSASQLKSTVYLAVAKIVEETAQREGVEPSPTFVAALVDLVFNQLVNLGEDLELFAHHAGRLTVMPADMYMATRKNEVLTRVLREFETKLEGNSRQ